MSSDSNATPGVAPLVQLWTRVSPEQAERLRRVAEGEYRSVSQELRRLIELRLDEVDELEQAA